MLTLPPTSLPTAQPTSMPSSSPTKVNLVLINALSVAIDKELVIEKAQYYLGLYIGYFSILFLLLLIIDKSKYGKNYVDRLVASAHSSAVHIPVDSTITSSNFSPREKDSAILRDLQRKDQILMQIIQNERVKEELDHMSLCRRGARLDGGEEDDVIENQTRSIEALESKANSKVMKLSASFYAYILQRRTYIGCEPLLYTGGYVQNMICFTWCFPKGAYEDFIIYISQNHPVLACIFAAKGGPLSRSGRRLVYIMQYSLAFFIKILAFGVCQYMELPQFISPAVSIFIITPLSVSFGTLIKYLYTCSCLVDNNEFRVKNPKLHRWIKFIGRLAAIPFVIGVVGLLVLASTFSCEKSRYETILAFLLQVQLVSFVLEILYAVLIFIPDYYYHLSLTTPFFSKSLVLIGALYAERLIKSTMRNSGDRDIFIHTRSYFGGVVRSETLCNRDYALKKGWITTGQVDDRESTVEMSEISDNSLFQSCNQVVTDNDSALEYTTSRISTFATENPLQSYMKSKSLKVNSMPTQPPHVSTSSVVSTSDDSRTANQLYRSYLKEVSLVERSSLSFEDWKLNRKKFKENTRHSFIAAYNNIADLIEGRTNERLRDLHFNRYRDNQHSNVEGENIQDGSSESNVKTMIRRFSALPPPPPPPPRERDESSIS